MQRHYNHAFVLTLFLAVILANAGQNIAQEVDQTMQIRIIFNNKTTVFELNNSKASADLFAQLPLNIAVEDYSDNEKIFYPPKKLNTTDTPLANASAGTLAYYAPWADAVMFYKDFGSAAGLYELGQAVSGSEHIVKMSGEIQIEKVENN